MFNCSLWNVFLKLYFPDSKYHPTVRLASASNFWKFYCCFRPIFKVAAADNLRLIFKHGFNSQSFFHGFQIKQECVNGNLIDFEAPAITFLKPILGVPRLQWSFPWMERKFGGFSKFRESDKSLKHELGSIKDSVCYLGLICSEITPWSLTQEIVGSNASR